MSKKITFTYAGNGKEYTLAFTRKTVEMMEHQGFRADEATEKPMTTLPKLFQGAFLAHHRYERKEVIDEIYASMTNRQELISKLIEMYNEPIATLLDEPEPSEGNVNWTASW